MINRIEIITKIPDARAEIIKKKISSWGFKKKIKSLWLVDVYTIENNFNKKQLEKIASSLFNPVTQTFTINNLFFPKKFSWALEIGFLPGVTDNIANTVGEIIEDLLKVKLTPRERVYSSRLIFLDGEFSENDISLIANNLINPLIQRTQIKNFDKYKKDKGMEKIIPKVKLQSIPQVDIVDLNVDDKELKKIGKLGITDKNGKRRGPLALDIIYMKTIQDYFKKTGRNPTDIELESIAQTWSEHCKHTIFNNPIDKIRDGLFETYIKTATEKIREKKGEKDFCVSVFSDNSGAIEFDKNFLITHKVETHNSPSALDPFGGSLTGILGVNRDAIGFGLGAKPIVNVYGFCFADPKVKTNLYRDSQLKQKMLSPKRIMEGVIEGVNTGGNCSGIPTPLGFVIFDQHYQGKPLVFVGTLGLIPKKIKGRLSYIKKARPGDLIVMVGGRVGLDGIHGATFSSEALNTTSPSTAVQIGDPITQKKLSDVLIKEARDLDLYHSITDNGAGGLSCSVAEMAKESGGCEVNLEKVPLKYPGLSPWQIWISESQERMTLAVPQKKWPKFFKLMKRRGVEATVIGKFTNSGRCLVKYKDNKIMDIDLKFLHYGLPSKPKKTSFYKPVLKEPSISQPKNLTKVLLKMLSRLNITSIEFISSQYDYEVQGTSVLKPLQGKGRVNSEAIVVRPILNSRKGVAVSQGIFPHYGDIDTYHMAACCIDTAIRNVITVGANIDYIALLDNFCWCSSNNPGRLYQLKKAAQACHDYAIGFGAPFISGKDSMFNDFNGFDGEGRPIKISIPPTLLISSIGIIDNINKTISIDAKFPGDLIYVLGETKEELGGSEYYLMNNQIGKSVPQVNVFKNKKTYQIFHQLANNNLIASAISVNRGGLGVALTKMAMAGKLGFEISLKRLAGRVKRDDFALFSESQGRIVVTINPLNKKKFEELLKDIPFSQIGTVSKNYRIVIKGLDEKTVVDLDINEALKTYRSTFKNY